MKRLVLASTSLPRQQLLQKLQIPFEIFAPNVDETPFNCEPPNLLVKRLALAKAQAANLFEDALIIGADQVAVVEGKIIGKPLTVENAQKQLNEVSGKRICFYVGLCLFDTKTNTHQITVETYEVVYRKLSNDMITNYLQREQPLQCAGSCKADGLGIVLIKELLGKDFTALIGLPLIQLVNMLTNAGYDPLLFCK